MKIMDCHLYFKLKFVSLIIYSSQVNNLIHAFRLVIFHIDHSIKEIICNHTAIMRLECTIMVWEKQIMGTGVGSGKTAKLYFLQFGYYIACF